MANLKETYAKEIVPALEKQLGVTNPMLVPRLTKIVVNMAFGLREKDEQKQLVQDLEDRPEGRPLQGPQEHLQLQAARGDAHRREGDAARQPHV